MRVGWSVGLLVVGIVAAVAAPAAGADAQLRAGLLRAAHLERVVPPERARVLRRLLREAQHPQLPLTATRVRILRETLAVNNNALAELSGNVRDVRARSGIVYRRYGDNGFRFQPLASFGRLNAALDAHDTELARTLTNALLARAERVGGALVWRYDFRIYGARAGWTSGLVQAVAADALARAGRLPEARRAFAAITPKLIVPLPQGPWVRLYSFSSGIVLNAQLQAMLSLRRYGASAADPQALRLAVAMARTARQLLPQFDTGWWSRYQLGGGLAAIDYHRYVTSLLWKSARVFGGSPWASAARRFSDDWRTPPKFTDRLSSPTVYIASRARSTARLTFRLSKPSYVTVRIGTASSTSWRAAGAHLLLWRPGPEAPRHAVAALSATDYAGNHASAVLPPTRVRADTIAPAVRATRIGGVVFWHAYDALSPRLRGALLFETARGWSIARLRNFHASGAFGGTPAGVPGWLLIADASGNATRVRLSNTCGEPSTHVVKSALPALRVRTSEALVWLR